VPLVLAALLALGVAPARWVLWAIAGFVWTVHGAEQRLAGRLPVEMLGRDVALSGWVDAFPTAAPGQVTFSLAVDGPRPRGIPSRLRLTWYDPPDLVAGDAVSVVARLRPPRGARNPAGFDYERWLLIAAYGATGYVRSGTILPDLERRSVARSWLGFRAELAERFAALVPDTDAAALLTALSLGERHRFSDQHWTDFRRTGLSHLVAVSGMHVGLIGLSVFIVLRRLWIRLPSPLGAYDLEAAAAASVLCTAWYAALTGFAVPAQRSLLMIAVALLVLVSRVAVGLWQGLAAALLLVLLWDPFAPLAASFWLSFGAVAVLLLLASPRRLAADPDSRARRLLGAGRALVGFQGAISLALLPLTAAFFAEVSWVAPFANLAAIPLFNLVLVPWTLLATVALALGATGAPIGLLVDGLAAVAGATVAAVHFVAEWRWAASAVPTPAAPVVAVAVLGTLLALPAHPLPGRRLGWLAVLPLLVPPRDELPAGAARIVLLDVGHGLAAIVETRTHRLLFDAGPSFRSGFDSGVDIVLPALGAKGPRRLDTLIVSHADNDHSGGAAAVLAAFPGTAVLKGPDVEAIPGEICERGQRWVWDEVTFSILHPPRGFPARGNDSSCVLEVRVDDTAALITGDVEARGEQALALQPRLAADVVVVPHHGSATSSSPELVRALDADYALVSAGYANRWGFPRPEVRSRWRDHGAAVLVTGESGALTVSLEARGVSVAAERDGRHRYWHAPP
jgi:competence protein ComEC